MCTVRIHYVRAYECVCVYAILQQSDRYAMCVRVCMTYIFMRKRVRNKLQTMRARAAAAAAATPYINDVILSDAMREPSRCYIVQTPRCTAQCVLSSRPRTRVGRVHNNMKLSYRRGGRRGGKLNAYAPAELQAGDKVLLISFARKLNNVCACVHRYNIKSGSRRALAAMLRYP